MVSPSYAVELLQKALELYTPSRSEAALANMIKDKCTNELGFEQVNIDSVMDLKLKAAMKHVSQFEPAIHHYRPDWDPKDEARAEAELKKLQPKKDGHYVEQFRRATGFNQE